MSTQFECCPICNGTYWIESRDEHGRFIANERCQCYYSNLSREQLRKNGLAEAVERMTFESFRTDEPWQETMKRKAEDFLTEIRSGKKPWLIFCGQSGSGKSHLCTAIVGCLIQDGRQVEVMQWVQDSRTIKADRESGPMLIERFKKPPYLLIDDLFKGLREPTEADIKLAFEILNYRNNNDLPTILSAEKSLNDLLLYDQATFSRVVEKTENGRFVISIGRDESRNYRLRGMR